MRISSGSLLQSSGIGDLRNSLSVGVSFLVAFDDPCQALCGLCSKKLCQHLIFDGVPVMHIKYLINLTIFP